MSLRKGSLTLTREKLLGALGLQTVSVGAREKKNTLKCELGLHRSYIIVF